MKKLALTAELPYTAQRAKDLICCAKSMLIYGDICSTDKKNVSRLSAAGSKKTPLCYSKVNRDAGALTSSKNLSFPTVLAFQRWFRIENRTIIEGVMETFVIFGTLCFLSKEQWTYGPTFCLSIDTHICSKRYKDIPGNPVRGWLGDTPSGVPSSRISSAFGLFLGKNTQK